MTNIVELLKNGQANVVDVRTPEEFVGGNVVGSINIPLNEIPHRLEEFKQLKNIVLCCAAGGRSHQATMFLQQNGIPCANGGSWMNVNYLKNN